MIARFFISIGIMVCFLGGCLVRAPLFRPPVRKRVIIPARPGKNFIWVKGHWAWRGGNYRWVNGYWVKPRLGKVWVQGHWVKRRGRWVWIKGHWRRR